jgi:hypothetical protein
VPQHLRKSHFVDMDQLMAFIFPPGRQHPRSTGRLLVYGLYGPLTADGRLTGGRGGSRTLTESEIDAMIDELELDDVLAVYTAGSVLGDVRQVAVDVRAASLGMPAMTRGQVAALLADLPRDSHGRCSFHDIQAHLIAVRAGRVRDMSKMYPDLVAGDPDAQRTRIRPPSPKFGRAKLHESMAATMATAAALAAGSGAGAGYTQLASSSLGGMGGGARSPTVKGAAARSGHSSVGIAMGGLDTSRKMGDVERYRAVAALQHRNTHMVATLADLHSPTGVAAVADNVKIVRADIPGSRDRFDRDAPLRLSPNRGTYVPGGGCRIDLIKRKV